MKKWKWLNVGTKIPYSDFLGYSFKKLYWYLKSAPSNLSNCQALWKMKMRNFGTKNTLFWYIAAGLSKQYLLIWNQHSPICQTMKLCKGIKMSKFGIKNTLFEYFEAGIWKEICLIWVQHLRLCLIGKFQETTTCLIWEFLSWNLKKQCSHSSNKHPWYFILKNVCEKMKMPKFGTKKSAPTNSHFICVFLGWNLKTILSYL